MKIAKKVFTLLLVSSMTFALFGCGETSQVNSKNDETIDILCTTYPQYDWARQVIGESNSKVTLNLIVDNGMDVHNYQPSAEDMIEIANSDLVIYNGGTSEEWVEEAVKNSGHIKTIEIMELLEQQMVEEELVEGMVHEHSHEDEEVSDADHTHKEDIHEDEETEHNEDSEVHEEQEPLHDEEHMHDEDGEVQEGKVLSQEEIENTSEVTEYDEHIWLSMKNAMIVVEEIKNVMTELDNENAHLYEQNTDTYVNELQALDKKYEETVNSGSRKVLLFGDRFPFRYLVEDYGLTYYAAFPGCSAETEASFETIVFLAEKVREHNLPCILTIDGSDKSIAESIKSNVGNKEIEILTLNSLQSVSKDSLETTTYLSVMEENLEVLKQALN